MKIADLGLTFERVHGAAPAWRARVDAAAWRATAGKLAAAGARLAALWACDESDRDAGSRVLALYATAEGLACLDLALPQAGGDYPDVADLFACAARMQRAARDM